MGQIYMDSGAANSIAFALFDKLMKNAAPRVRKVIAVALIYVVGCLMCYGGVDSAALMFTLVPLALVFFQVADLPRKYVSAVCVHTSCICLGGIGVPAFYNIYPGQVLGTTAMAGSVVGVTALLINVIGGVILTNIWVAKDEKKGLGGFEWGNARQPEYDRENMPHPVVALIPLVVSMVLFMAFGVHFVGSIGVGLILSLVLFHKNFKTAPGVNLNKAIAAMLTKGTAAGMNGALLITSMAAFGAMVQTTPVFQGVADALLNIPGPKVIMYALLVGILGIVTGAALSGFQAGLGMAMASSKFGLVDAALHRIGALSASTFNLAPFTGVVLVTLNLAGLSHKEGYGTMLKIPVLAMLVVTAVATILYALFPTLP